MQQLITGLLFGTATTTFLL